MEEETEFILQCNSANSFIEQVLYSKNNFDNSVLLNQPLLFCLAPESLETGKTFFDTIRLVGKAENYNLALLLGEEEHVFSFSGAQLNNHIILIAQHAPQSIHDAVTEATEELISQEIENSLNTTGLVQETDSEPKQREVTVWDLLEEMSRLNNELINTKRELVRKNLELERLQQMLKKG